MKLRRVAVANRGEIALRIMRTCREAGIEPLALYSEADAGAPFVRYATAAICVGPAPAAASYLNVEAMTAGAAALHADAVHPGYGFLSESPLFARACDEAGMAFIGPSPECMDLLTNKSAARRTMAAAGVPVVPGYDGEDQSDAALLDAARLISFPVLIKAVSGGGGRGLRIAGSAAVFLDQLAEARREAVAARGDSRVLLELYLDRPRHIEVQVFGDTHGGVLHLGERECSLQRRHQKVIEESPSPALTANQREEVCQTAVAVAKASAYCGAGTVEFLFEPATGRFYFLEVNARLQVEHPVTEMVTGLDLVRMQLEIAAGKPMRWKQSEVRWCGHAIEARVCAEDPETHLPSAGEIAAWAPPVGPGVRCDTGVERGSIVPSWYDPLLAKVICSGETRDLAAARLEQALLHFDVLGIATSIPDLLRILRHPTFVQGDLYTRLLEEELDTASHDQAPPDEVLLALAAISASGADVRGAPATSPKAPDPWREGAGWRN
ncbi:MAG: hypothetical protein KGJ62_03275 [Armatimonadetes bacterium]|nr:hypothetical protein [Armatimonadota bacterium]MDE2205745.1 hypothetical protein [Armatimonadota bacterium]